MEHLKEVICMFREQNVTVVESSFHECKPDRRKLAVKVVDIFGNDTMTIVDVNMGGKTANERKLKENSNYSGT